MWEKVSYMIRGPPKLPEEGMLEQSFQGQVGTTKVDTARGHQMASTFVQKLRDE